MKHSRAKFLAIGFMFAVALGCGSRMITTVVPGIASHLHLGSARGSHLGLTKSAHNVSAIEPSSNYAYAQATTATVSDDFHGTCDFAPHALDSVPPGFLVALPSDPDQVGASCIGVSDPQTPLHTSATDAGTASRLKVDMVLDDGTKLRCQDKTNSSSIADADPVGLYFKPDTGAVVAFGGAQGTTQLPNTCTLVVPAGRFVRHIEAHLLKG